MPTKNEKKIEKDNKKSKEKSAPSKKTAVAVKSNKKSTKNLKLSSPIHKQPSKLTGQKKKFWDMLMNMRARILGQVQALSEEALSSGAVTGEHSSTMTNHIADYASDNFMHAMELDIMTGEMEDIEMIDEALERLVNGEYGKCLDCGCKIPIGRLEAKPHARFCVECKSKREQNAEKIEFER